MGKFALVTRILIFLAYLYNMQFFKNLNKLLISLALLLSLSSYHGNAIDIYHQRVVTELVLENNSVQINSSNFLYSTFSEKIPEHSFFAFNFNQFLKAFNSDILLKEKQAILVRNDVVEFELKSIVYILNTKKTDDIHVIG